MFDRCSIAPPSAKRVSSLYLDYGADAQECDEDAVAICERGMQVRSRWKFDVGTELSLDFVYGETRCTAEVTVVSCVPVPGGEGLYESTLLFLEFPEELRFTVGSASR